MQDRYPHKAAVGLWLGKVAWLESTAQRTFETRIFEQPTFDSSFIPSALFEDHTRGS